MSKKKKKNRINILYIFSFSRILKMILFILCISYYIDGCLVISLEVYPYTIVTCRQEKRVDLRPYISPQQYNAREEKPNEN